MLMGFRGRVSRKRTSENKPKVMTYDKIPPMVFNGTREQNIQLAKEAGVSVEQFEKDIEKLKKAGLFVQDNNGNWYIRTA